MTTYNAHLDTGLETVFLIVDGAYEKNPNIEGIEFVDRTEWRGFDITFVRYKDVNGKEHLGAGVKGILGAPHNSWAKSARECSYAVLNQFQKPTSQERVVLRGFINKIRDQTKMDVELIAVHSGGGPISEAIGEILNERGTNYSIINVTPQRPTRAQNTAHIAGTSDVVTNVTNALDNPSLTNLARAVDNVVINPLKKLFGNYTNKPKTQTKGPNIIWIDLATWNPHNLEYLKELRNKKLTVYKLMENDDHTGALKRMRERAEEARRQRLLLLGVAVNKISEIKQDRAALQKKLDSLDENDEKRSEVLLASIKKARKNLEELKENQKKLEETVREQILKPLSVRTNETPPVMSDERAQHQTARALAFMQAAESGLNIIRGIIQESTSASVAQSASKREQKEREFSIASSQRTAAWNEEMNRSLNLSLWKQMEFADKVDEIDNYLKGMVEAQQQFDKINKKLRAEQTATLKEVRKLYNSKVAKSDKLIAKACNVLGNYLIPALKELVPVGKLLHTSVELGKAGINLAGALFSSEATEAELAKGAKLAEQTQKICSLQQNQAMALQAKATFEQRYLQALGDIISSPTTPPWVKRDHLQTRIAHRQSLLDSEPPAQADSVNATPETLLKAINDADNRDLLRKDQELLRDSEAVKHIADRGWNVAEQYRKRWSSSNEDTRKFSEAIRQTVVLFTHATEEERTVIKDYTATLNIGHGFAIRDRQIKEVDYGRLPG